jgi:Flp pilus assembly protein TadG
MTSPPNSTLTHVPVMAGSPNRHQTTSLRCRKTRVGAATVEFAVIAPLFVLLLFGMIEFGRLVMVQQVITNASREGARRAVVEQATTADVTSAVQTYLTNGGVKATSAVVTVNPNPPTAAGLGEPVTVQVQVPFSAVSWLPSPMFLGKANLNATTTMRRESDQ